MKVHPVHTRGGYRPACLDIYIYNRFCLNLSISISYYNIYIYIHIMLVNWMEPLFCGYHSPGPKTFWGRPILK